MGLFDFIRKGSYAKSKCRTQEQITGDNRRFDPNRIYSVKVLGTGCKLCHEQLKNVRMAAKALGLQVEVEYITDIKEITNYGVMSMPAIVINDKVAAAGRLLKPDEVKNIIAEA